MTRSASGLWRRRTASTVADPGNSASRSLMRIATVFAADTSDSKQPGPRENARICSLRRHDPDQVLRVSGLPLSQPLGGAPRSSAKVDHAEGNVNFSFIRLAVEAQDHEHVRTLLN